MNSNGFRFAPWLLGFFVALVAIPFLIYLQLFLVAKILGITVTVTLVVVLRIWLHQLKKQGPGERYSLTSNDVFELHSLVPAFKDLSTHGNGCYFFVHAFISHVSIFVPWEK